MRQHAGLKSLPPTAVGEAVEVAHQDRLHVRVIDVALYLSPVPFEAVVFHRLPFRAGRRRTEFPERQGPAWGGLLREGEEAEGEVWPMAQHTRSCFTGTESKSAITGGAHEAARRDSRAYRRGGSSAACTPILNCSWRFSGRPSFAAAIAA